MRQLLKKRVLNIKIVKSQNPRHNYSDVVSRDINDANTKKVTFIYNKN
jgi:hypothetical protein